MGIVDAAAFHRTFNAELSNREFYRKQQRCVQSPVMNQASEEERSLCVLPEEHMAAAHVCFFTV